MWLFWTLGSVFVDKVIIDYKANRKALPSPGQDPSKWNILIPVQLVA